MSKLKWGSVLKSWYYRVATLANTALKNTFCFSLGICQDLKEFIEKIKSIAETRDYSEPMRALRI